MYMIIISKRSRYDNQTSSINYHKFLSQKNQANYFNHQYQNSRIKLSRFLPEFRHIPYPKNFPKIITSMTKLFTTFSPIFYKIYPSSIVKIMVRCLWSNFFVICYYFSIPNPLRASFESPNVHYFFL